MGRVSIKSDHSHREDNEARNRRTSTTCFASIHRCADC